jgi:argininosuccinate lyase
MPPRRLWGARFTAPLSETLRRLNDSFPVDHVLLPEEIRASTAWARALRRAGVLRAREAAALIAALGRIGRRRIGTDVAAHEDVHSYVEAALRARLGPVAGKIHSGRSRNDQVATDLRLYLKAALLEARAATLELCGALARRAAAEAATAMPGYTHLKRAEPVTFGHFCLAYVEMLLRDVSRLDEARARGDECPLGSAALSGTPLPIDRARLSRDLGFARAAANSLDAVSDRDLAADYLYAAALLLVHLSRLSEDLIVYSSDEFGFVALPDALATGSSRMPHKRNPDLLELARGHAARAIGDLAGLLALLKGLPTAYDKDLQLDKEPVFRMRATLLLVLPAMTALVGGLRLDRARMRRAASGDAMLATDLADALAARGVPFRRAHEMVGAALVRADARGVSLEALGPGGGITAADFRALDVDRSLRRRRAPGGTAPARVGRAAADAARRIARLRAGGSR